MLPWCFWIGPTLPALCTFLRLLVLKLQWQRKNPQKTSGPCNYMRNQTLKTLTVLGFPSFAPFNFLPRQSHLWIKILNICTNSGCAALFRQLFRSTHRLYTAHDDIGCRIQPRLSHSALSISPLALCGHHQGSREFSEWQTQLGQPLSEPICSGQAKHTNWSYYANLRLPMHSSRIVLCKCKIIYDI